MCFPTTFKKKSSPNYHALLANDVHFPLSIPIPCLNSARGTGWHQGESFLHRAKRRPPCLSPWPYHCPPAALRRHPDLWINIYNDKNHVKVCTASSWCLCWRLQGRRSKARLETHPPARPWVRRAGSTQELTVLGPGGWKKLQGPPGTSLVLPLSACQAPRALPGSDLLTGKNYTLLEFLCLPPNGEPAPGMATGSSSCPPAAPKGLENGIVNKKNEFCNSQLLHRGLRQD